MTINAVIAAQSKRYWRNLKKLSLNGTFWSGWVFYLRRWKNYIRNF